MPQSLARVFVHLVFSTKDRLPWLSAAVRADLYPYLVTVLGDHDCPALRVGGVDDHVHLLFGLSRTLSLAALVEALKTSSSKHLKTLGPDYAGFHWQRGYAAFSVSQSEVAKVVHYIENQEAHHRRISFQSELRRFFDRHQVAYDERYVWD